MTLEFTPTLKCNIACAYCYQNPVKEAGPQKLSYNLDLVIPELAKDKTPFTVFGGEPLLIPIDDLERLFIFGYGQYKQNGIQTNGILITARHIELFKKYNVHVGVSIDGPEELNEARTTLALTARTQANLILLAEAKIGRSLIVTLSRSNCSIHRLPRFLEWIKELESLGYKTIRLHLLENDGHKQELNLNDGETINVLEAIRSLNTKIEFDLFTEIEKRIRGNMKAGSCVFHGCDPFTTPAVQAVDGFGKRHNCTRVNKEGVDFVKAARHGNERDVALYNTPQEDGGCKGCRFFSVCRGFCPGTAILGDWRNRTVFCNVLKHLYIVAERKVLSEGRLPVSLLGRQVGLGKNEHGDAPHGDRTYLVVPVRRRAQNTMGVRPGSATLGTDIHQDP